MDEKHRAWRGKMSEIVEFHNALQNRVCTFMNQHFGPTLAECRLPNGTRADLITIQNDKTIIITEIKSVLPDLYIQSAAKKYSTSCHLLFIAAPNAEINKVKHLEGMAMFGNISKRPGLIRIDYNEIHIVANPMRRNIQANTAKLICNQVMEYTRNRARLPVMTPETSG